MNIRHWARGVGFASMAFLIALAVAAEAGPLRDKLAAGRAARLEQAAGKKEANAAGALVTRDVKYGPSPAQAFDVYAPKAAKGAPIILMVHGGGWAVGDKAHGPVVTNKVSHYLAKGYIFVSTNYRMVPEADPREQARDVARALAAVQDKALDWGGDPARVILMGHSAGAHLISLINADPSLAKDAGAEAWLGVVSLDSGAYDVEAIMKHRHAALYDEAFGTDKELWRSSSPSAQLRGEPSPMLLVCSSQRKESCAQAVAFKGKLLRVKARGEVLPQALSHREINERLGLKGQYTESVDSFIDAL